MIAVETRSWDGWSMDAWMENWVGLTDIKMFILGVQCLRGV